MIYSLSKLLPALLMPLTLLLVCAFYLYYRRPKPNLTVFSLLFFGYLMSTPWLGEQLKQQYELCWSWPSDDVKARYAIILGGAFKVHPYQHDAYQLTGAADRFHTGIRFVREGKANKIVISGGRAPGTNRPPEAQLAMRYIREYRMLPDSLVILEEQSVNTEENARFTWNLLTDEERKEPIFLITSARHLHRSVHLFEHVGFTVIPVPTDIPLSHESHFAFPLNLFPTADALANNSNHLRERMGYWYYRLKYRA